MGEHFLVRVKEWLGGGQITQQNLNLQPDEATLFVLGLRGKEIGY